jgi:hypothetical protein
MSTSINSGHARVWTSFKGHSHGESRGYRAKRAKWWRAEATQPSRRSGKPFRKGQNAHDEVVAVFSENAFMSARRPPEPG